MEGPKIRALPYVDIQHDALTVFDDVEQGVVAAEDVWVSGYRAGSSSVHGKVRVEAPEGGGSSLRARGGVQVDRISKANFKMTIPSLGVEQLPVRFPKQVVHPPFKKAKDISAPLHINALAYSPALNRLAIGGQDGYLVVLPLSAPSAALVLSGHVGDVLSTCFFPSGQVLLTTSSDLTARVFSATDGANPRTLRGHTRAVTAARILGVGKEVLTASKDGSVRLWTVGSAKEEARWDAGGAVEDIAVVSAAALGLDLDDADVSDERKCTAVLAFRQDGAVAACNLAHSRAPPLFVLDNAVGSNLLCAAVDTAAGLLATGHANGVVALRLLGALTEAPTLVRRNESPVYSLLFETGEGGVDLLVGTGAGLPARLRVSGTTEVRVVEELAGWEAVGVECWARSEAGVWCAGGEGGVRRY
ncbi:hypothetical protein Q5752_002772 [Cryptotrichosporon argae]